MDDPNDHEWETREVLGDQVLWVCTRCSGLSGSPKGLRPGPWTYVADSARYAWLTCLEKRLESVKTVLKE